MASVTWPNLTELDHARMSAARRQAHNAVHWLVRFANSYAPPSDDGSHTRLVWNARDNAIETTQFLDGLSVELRVSPLEMQFREGGRPAPHIMDFEERTPAHVEAWVLVELLHRGVDRSRYSKALPYRAQDLMTGDNEEYAPDEYAQELAALDQSFRAGAIVLQELRKTAGLGLAPDAPLYCWPDVFQLGHDIPLPPGSGAKAVRVGIALGDGVRPEPYFFAGTTEQAQTASFQRDQMIMLREIVRKETSLDNVVAALAGLVRSLRLKLSG